MFANYSFCNISYHLIQFHPWIGIISGGVAETKEAEDLRKREKERKEMKNKDVDDQDGEAMMMEEVGDD